MPQLRFVLTRGSEWKGSYTILQPDELLYSAYINSLIDGRPLRNDPSTGEDDHPGSPLPESLFSIQFVPPLVIASLAKLFGATASSAFIFLTGAVGLLSSVSIYWLLVSLTGRSQLAAVGVLFVLCFGALAAGQGLIGLWLNPEVKFLGLPFLRRYLPAAGIPIFFVLCTLVWHAFKSNSRRSTAIMSILGGISFGALVFSYFYLWTAALAWLVSVALLWLLLRPLDRLKLVRVLALMSVPALMALALYFHLISRLPPALNKAQVLTFTHRPDLFRVPEVIGIIVLLLLLIALIRSKRSFREPEVVFLISFAILPVLVFNQQVLSGRSIQPFHYEVFIVNYVVLLAVVLLWGYMRQVLPVRTGILVASLCLVWGTTEINLPLQAHYSLHLGTDEMVPVLKRLKELAPHDGSLAALANKGKVPGVVFSEQYGISELLPTWAPQGSLLAPGSASFQTLSEEERKKRLYMHFYYCNASREYMRDLLSDRGNLFLGWRAKSTIFGPERVSSVLASQFKPIERTEVEQEIDSYDRFVKAFSREQASEIPLSYAVILANHPFDFSHIDNWYERDAGEHVGNYILYHLRLRQ